MDVDGLARDVLKKKSLSGVSISVVRSEIADYISRNSIDLGNATARDCKIIIDDLRARLRKMVGSYRSESKLDKHASAVEREQDYGLLREKINSIEPESILDLGCGINPIYLARLGLRYYAYDIDELSIRKVSVFMHEKGIAGFTKLADIRGEDEFPRADLCLLLKVLDVIDEKDHKNSENLIKKLDCKNLIISFSTKTLSGAPMRHPQRGWIERLLARLGFEFESFSGKNEIFYLAKKKY